MKTLVILVVLCLAVFAVGQTFGPPQLGWPGPIATSTSQCSIPQAHAASICPVEAPVGVVTYYQWNGSGWAAGGAGGNAGVTSFNGRSGAVTSQPGDYAYSDLKNPPTSQSCTNSSLNNTGFNANGCAYK